MIVTGNRLLDCAPDPIRAQILAIAKHVMLPEGFVLSSAHHVPESVYFPVSGLAVQLVTSPEKGEVAVGLLGLDDVANCFALLGARTSASRCFMLMPGEAYAIPIAAMQTLFDENADVRQFILAHLQFQLALHDQISACNCLHEVKNRLPFWLLTIAYQVDARTFRISQQNLASLLGAQRTTVSLCAIDLRQAGSISYSRAVLKIIDLDRLRAEACSCYAVTRKLISELRHTVAGAHPHVSSPQPTQTTRTEASAWQSSSTA